MDDNLLDNLERIRAVAKNTMTSYWPEAYQSLDSDDLVISQQMKLTTGTLAIESSCSMGLLFIKYDAKVTGSRNMNFTGMFWQIQCKERQAYFQGLSQQLSTRSFQNEKMLNITISGVVDRYTDLRMIGEIEDCIAAASGLSLHKRLF